jgi:hypothetical protein
MASRPLIIATLVGASVGVPYLTSQTKTAKPGTAGAPAAAGSYGQLPSGATAMPTMNYGQQTSMPAIRLPTTMPAAPALLPGASAAPQVAATPGGTTQVAAMPVGIARPAINGAQFASIDQVLRFDVTKEWVYQNWDRKSAGATDVGLMGVRVPLVMSPQVYSLAGSLTYYFNEQGQVEHISFRGRTGDPAQLVHLLTTRYQFQRVQSMTGEQVYQVQNKGQIQSELRTHPESVAYLNTPNQSVAVELEFARPGSSRVLPPRPTGFEAMAAQQQQQAIAQAAAQAQAAQKSANVESSAGNSYFSKVRYATPEEQSQVLWQRWPK